MITLDKIKMTKIRIDDVEYDTDKFSEKAAAQLENLKFVEQLILQKTNEMQIGETAKLGYQRALKIELEKIKVK